MLNATDMIRVLNNNGDFAEFRKDLLLLYKGKSDCIRPFTQKKLIAPERKISFS